MLGRELRLNIDADEENGDREMEVSKGHKPNSDIRALSYSSESVLLHVPT